MKYIAPLFILTVILSMSGRLAAGQQRPIEVPSTGWRPQEPSQAVRAGLRTLAFDQESSWQIGASGTNTWYCPDVWYYSTVPCSLPYYLVNGGVLELDWTNAEQSPYDTGVGTMSPDGASYTAWYAPLYIEVSAQFDPVPGAWPAIWMANISATRDYTVTSPYAKNYGELDVVEGNSPAADEVPAYYTTIHDWYCSGSGCGVADRDNNNSSNAVSVGSGNMWDYHTWGALLTRTGVTWYLDNVEINHTRCSAHVEACAALLESPLYLMLSDQVGVNWSTGREAPPAAYMNVQWVHIWE